MSTDYDIIVVGAGLAGTCCALHLSERKRILLVDSDDPPAGASAVAAGLVNPFMARKARPVWRHREALDALQQTLELANARTLQPESGVLRPASDGEQAAYFQSTARDHEECRWLTPGECSREYPDIHAPHGALSVRSGCAVDIPSFVGRAFRILRATGSDVRLGVRVVDFAEKEKQVHVQIRTSAGHETDTTCNRLLLACGAGFRTFRQLNGLGLHAVKGQTVDLRVPQDLTRLPHLAGAGYVVTGRGRATVGASFEHEFENIEPDPAAGAQLVRKAAKMLPLLEDAEITRHRAGVRVTVAGRRLPIVGSVPGFRRVWIFIGLGSKGLLMAPLVASGLANYLTDVARIPPEISLDGLKSVPRA